MSQYLCAKTYKLRPAMLRSSLLGMSVLAAMAALGSAGCEDKAIGRSCDVLTDAAPAEGVYNSEALDCPSRICMKPVDQNAVPLDPATTAYCSAGCSQDSDCNGEVRATPCPGNTVCPSSGQCSNGASCLPDTRCLKGFTCGIPYVKGKLCCQKVCICKDFIPSYSSPKACDPDQIVSTCGTPVQ
jgi:hypothetical protein